MLTKMSANGRSWGMLTIVSSHRILNSTDLGTAIREARRAQHLSQIDLARHAHVARGALQKLETGRGDLNLGTVFKLLQILSLDLSIVPRSKATSWREETASGL